MRPRWVKWEMKTKHFCPCEFLSQNKDTHPPFSLRFNTKHQLALNLQTTLLSSLLLLLHVMQRLRHLFWWPLLSTKVMLTLWAVPAGSCAQMQELRCPGDDAQSPIPIFHILHSVTKAFPVAECLFYCLLAGLARQVTDDDHLLAAHGSFCFPAL